MNFKQAGLPTKSSLPKHTVGCFSWKLPVLLWQGLRTYDSVTVLLSNPVPQLRLLPRSLVETCWSTWCRRGTSVKRMAFWLRGFTEPTARRTCTKRSWVKTLTQTTLHYLMVLVPEPAVRYRQNKHRLLSSFQVTPWSWKPMSLSWVMGPLMKSQSRSWHTLPTYIVTTLSTNG